MDNTINYCLLAVQVVLLDQMCGMLCYVTLSAQRRLLVISSFMSTLAIGWCISTTVTRVTTLSCYISSLFAMMRARLCVRMVGLSLYVPSMIYQWSQQSCPGRLHPRVRRPGLASV